MVLRVSILAIGFALAICFPSNISAAVTVTALVTGLESLEQSQDVQLVRFGSFDADPVAMGEKLEFGDELRSLSNEISVELTCPEGSLITLSAPFRVVIKFSNTKDCVIDLLGGSADVLTDQPTGIESGEVTLGSRRTLYGMLVFRNAKGPVQEAYVYDGKVDVRSSKTDRPIHLKAGSKYLVSSRPQRPRKLSKKDINRTARVFAQVDASKIKTESINKQKAFTNLVKNYQLVLTSPDNPDSRIKLAIQQLHLKVNTSSSIYHLNQAEAAKPKDREQQAVIALTKGIALKQMGDPVRSEEEFSRAKKIDPNIMNQKTLKSYQLNPVWIKQMDYSDPSKFQKISKSLSIETRVRPARINVGQSTRIFVVAKSPAGHPIPNASVTVASGGGFFPASNQTTASGRTNAKGEFVTSWACKSCASGYEFSVKVTKKGYTTTEGSAKVSIKH